MQVSIGNTINQAVVAAALVSLCKYLGSKIEKLDILNIPGSFKSVALSAAGVSAVFKSVDLATKAALNWKIARPLQSYQLGIRTTLSAIGGYLAAKGLASRGLLREEYKIPFLMLSTVVYLFMDGENIKQKVQQRIISEANRKNIDPQVDAKVQERVKQAVKNPNFNKEVFEGVQKRITEEVNSADINKAVREGVELRITEAVQNTEIDQAVHDGVQQRITEAVQNTKIDQEVHDGVQQRITEAVNQYDIKQLVEQKKKEILNDRSIDEIALEELIELRDKK